MCMSPLSLAWKYTYTYIKQKKIETQHSSGEQGVPEKENREQGGLF